MKKIKALDCFAGIAILMIVLVHSYQQIDGIHILLQKIVSYGRIGTQLFFVLSGFKITMSLHSNNNIKTFYYKRYLNIAIPYYIAILFWMMLTQLCPMQNGIGWKQNKNPLAIIWNLLLLNGIFVEGNNDVVPGGWYIGTTVLFYLIAPAFIRMLEIIKKRSHYLLLVVPFATFYVGRVIMWILTPFNGVVLTDYTSIWEQLPCISVGCILFYLYDENIFENKNIKIGCAIVVAAVLGLKILRFPIIRMIDSVFIFSLIYGILIIMFFQSSCLDSKIGDLLQRLGIVSYEMYFVHFVFAWYVIPYLQKSFFPNMNGNAFFVIVYLLNCFISYGISCVYHMGLTKVKNIWRRKISC